MFICPVCGWAMLVVTVAYKQELTDWARQAGLLWPFNCGGCGNRGMRRASQEESDHFHDRSPEGKVKHAEVQQRFSRALRPNLVADYNEEAREWEWNEEKASRARAARK